MASKSLGNPQISGHSVDELRVSTQFWLQQVFNHLDKLTGLRGTPTFFNSLDVQGNTLRNLGDGADPQDAVSFGQALTVTPATTTTPAQYDAGGLSVVNMLAGINGTDAVTLDQVVTTITTMVSLATAGFTFTALAVGFSITGGVTPHTLTVDLDLTASTSLNVGGTANRITTSGTTTLSAGGTVSTLDIAATYVGQASITTLGTVTTGTWNATTLTGQYGGTGVANTGKSITLGGNLTTTGAFDTVIILQATATYTLPISGATLLGNNVGIAGGSILIGDSAASGTLTFKSTSNATKGNILFGSSAYDEANNRLGIVTTAPTNDLSFGGNAGRIAWMERHTTANTAGNSLTLQSGGATSGATDKAGGNLLLSSGTSTGTGQSNIQFQTAPAGSTGTADNAPATKITFSSTNAGGTTNLVTIAETLPTTLTAGVTGFSETYTTAGSSTFAITGHLITLAAGYTGSSNTQGIGVTNNVAGTGTTFSAGPYRPNGNIALALNCAGTTTGNNTGIRGVADNGNQNFGIWGSSTVDKASATNVGVVGIGLNAAATPLFVGGYFATMSGTVVPTFTNAALICNNGTQVTPIFLAQDNAVTTFSIIDGGNVGIGGAFTPTNLLSLSGQAARIMWMERHTTANTAGNSLTLQSGGASSGATDKAGGDCVVQPGLSTGNAVPARIRLKGTNAAGASGTGDQTIIDRFTPNAFVVLTNNVATTVVSATVAELTGIGIIVDYCIEVVDGTDIQTEVGRVYIHAQNKGGVITAVATETSSQQTTSAGTLATTWAASAATPCLISVNANSSLTGSSGYPRITFSVLNLGQQSVV